jgi:hypothetical protein
MIWNGNSSIYHVKQYYFAHREILFHIWNHPRVLAYPGGVRYLRVSEFGEMEPISGNMQDIGYDKDQILSRDEYEIMWKHPNVDSFGDPIGPIFTASALRDLVEYLKQPNNNGIDFLSTI